MLTQPREPESNHNLYMLIGINKYYKIFDRDLWDVCRWNITFT